MKYTLLFLFLLVGRAWGDQIPKGKISVWPEHSGLAIVESTPARFVDVMDEREP